MKIAVWHNLNSGGAKRALYHHVKGLLERGHHIEAWCPDTVDQAYLPLNELIKENIIPIKANNHLFNRARRRILGPVSRMNERISNIKQHCLECAEQINNKGFDVLFANSSSDFHISFIGLYVKIPKIIYLGEPYRKLYEASPVLPWIAPETDNLSFFHPVNAFKKICQSLKETINTYALRIQAREELRAAKSYDRILVNSYFSRESVLRAYGLNPWICYLGINPDMFHQPNKPKEAFVVGMGSLQHTKGIDRAIKAIAAIPKSKRPKLIWIANTKAKKYKDKMQKLASSLQVDLDFQIRIPDHRLKDLLSCAAVMIYRSRLEPFGLAPLEANACCTAVIGIAEGGIRESVISGENGILINNEAPHEIAEAILSFTENLDYATEFGIKACKHVRNIWDSENAIDELEKYLKETVLKTKFKLC